MEGPAQEVYFGQKHLPGRLCASDFTHTTELEITLAGQTLEHMVYHFVLTYSNWETGTICYSESLESLSEGWRNAVWELGAVAAEHLDHVEVRYGQRKVEDLPRLRGRGKYRIDYRHIIEWLVRKPGAFENYRYQEDLFPTSRFRMAYDALRETMPGRSSKEYLQILKLAAEQGEVQVDEALRELLERRTEAVITVESISEVLATLNMIPPVTMVEVEPVDLAIFDQLCLEMEVER